jgi:hypothetical protein
MMNQDEIWLIESAKWSGRGIKLGETGGLNIVSGPGTNFGVAFWIMFDVAGFNHAGQYDHYVQIADRTIFDCQNTKLVITDEGALKYIVYDQYGGNPNPYWASGTIQPNTLYFITCDHDGLTVNGERCLTNNCSISTIHIVDGAGMEIGPNLNATIYDLAILNLGQKFTANQISLIYNNGNGCDIRKTSLLSKKTYENQEFIKTYFKMDTNLDSAGIGRYLLPIKTDNSYQRIIPMNFTSAYDNPLLHLKSRTATHFEI